jgi:arylsulfatase A-like enzyme
MPEVMALWHDVGPMNTFRCIRRFVLIVGALLFSIIAAAQEPRPNIIVMLADDLGYADVGYHGLDPNVRTPHIDALAARGVKFTSAYITAPQCTPSRAGLITGRYNQRFGVNVNSDRPLPRNQLTIADRLSAAGYITGIVGKWHLDTEGRNPRLVQLHMRMPATTREAKANGDPFAIALRFYPQFYGFREYFVGNTQYYWASHDIAGTPLHEQGQLVAYPDDRTALKTLAAISFIDRHRKKPFFLFLSYFNPHPPLTPSQVFLNQQSESLSSDRRNCLALVQEVDESVGTIVRHLRNRGRLDNTLIIFLSDHGADTSKELISEDDSDEWNGSLNLPLRGGKGMLTEGGIRVPFFMTWPDGLPADATFDQPVSSLDIAATAVALAAQPPAPELDGTNLIPYIKDRSMGSPHEALYWRFFRQAAIRKGNWKYIYAGTKREYLFDVENDPYESRNLASEHPEIADTLHDELREWADTLQPPGLPDAPLEADEIAHYRQAFGRDFSSD